MKRSPIISPEELARILSSPNLVLIDARPGDAWTEGHLPGAVHAELNRDLSTATRPGFDPRRGGRHPLPPAGEFARQLGRWGISADSSVVIYDEADASNAAARAWWMVRSLGHDDVRVLDGGFQAAVAAGLPVTAAPSRPVDKGAYPADSWQLPLADLAEVDRARRTGSWKVLDVRSGERFRAETEPIDPIAGHIPGAVNLYFAGNTDGGRFKKPAELREQYENLLEGTPADHLIVHCGSGVTACQTLLALEIAGLEGASLYVGSWGEWCRNENLPRAEGE